MRKQTVSEWLLLHSLPSEIRELNQSRAGFVKVLVFCLNCLLHFISWFARTVQLAVYYCCLGRAIFNAEPLRPTLSLSQHCGSVGYSHFCLLACLLSKATLFKPIQIFPPSSSLLLQLKLAARCEHPHFRSSTQQASCASERVLYVCAAQEI